MFLKRALLLFFLCCLLGLRGRGQFYSSDYHLFTTRDGLPHNNVLSVLQDSYGFLWLGTYNGLSVYDGSSFKTYKPFARQEDNWMYAIETIYEDASGNLWVGTWGGLVSCFNRKEQKFIEYRTKPMQAKVMCFYTGQDGQVWIGYSGGFIGRIRKDSIDRVPLINGSIVGIAGRGTDSLLLLSLKRQYVYTISSGSVYAMPPCTDLRLQDIDKSRFPTIAMGVDGFYVWGGNGLQRAAETTIPQHNRSTAYSKVALSQHGYYYYTDGFAIYKYDSVNRQAGNYVISDNITFDKNNIINAFIEDRFGILWLGTTSGLYKIDQKKHQFQKYTINNKSGYLTHNYVRAVCIDHKQNAWIGFRPGTVNKLVRKGNKDQYVYAGSYTIKGDRHYAHTRNYSVNTIFETSDGVLLVGGESGVLSVKDNRYLSPFLPEKYRSSVTLVWALYEDKEANIWLGTNGFGLFVFNRHTRALYRYLHKPGDTSSIPDDKVWKIYEDKQGTVWVGTDKGLVQAKTDSGIASMQFRYFRLPGAEAPNVWTITEDNTGGLWVGTTGNGAYKIALASMQAYPVSKIKARVISAIIIDSAQNAWISTTGGLYKYNIAKDIVHYYSEDDGLLTNDFNFNAAAITGAGNIFMGTKSGLVFFDPQEITHHATTKAQVVLSSLQVNGKEETKRLYANRPVVLTHHENNFSIGFALLDFSPARPFRYRYRLQNYTADWTYLPDLQNRAFYHNVPPGEYYFVVEGSSDGIRWHSQERTLSIIIKPAFWQMPAFWIAMVMLLLVAAALIIRMRFVKAIRTERAQAKVEKQIAELELQALQAQMNPHFIFNTMNSIQHFILNHNEVEANDYLSRFARLMRLVLESSKNKYITLKTELESLALYLSLEQLRFEDQFDYEIDIADGIEPGQVMIPSLLIQPFVENAIKHGLAPKSSGGLLRLTFDKKCDKGDCLRVLIDDNGIGRANAAKTSSHISRGMQLIDDRVKTYNNIENRKISILIIDKEAPRQGTIVKIERH